MGREIAREAYRRGAEVTVVHDGQVPCMHNVVVSTAGEMREAVLSLLGGEGADIYVSAAAISDFVPVRQAGKMRSGQEQTLTLRPVPS